MDVDDGDGDGGGGEWVMVCGWVGGLFWYVCERGFSHITTAVVIKGCLKQAITVHIETRHCECKAKFEFGATNRDTCDRYCLR